MRVTDGFVEQAQRHPDKPAVILAGQDSCTYGELLQAAQQIAEQTQSGQLAALLLPNSIEFLSRFLGTVLGGGIAMVLDPGWTAAQIQTVLDRYRCDRVYGESGETIRTENDRSGQTSTFDRSKLPADAFYIGFTSGTTGLPKGVVRTHASWLSSFTASRVEFGTCAADQMLVPGSLVHSLSLYAALETLNAGATLHLLPRFSPRLALEQLTHYPVTVLVGVPTVLKSIAKIVSSAPVDSALRTVIAGGSKVDLELRQQLPQVFPNADIVEYFGALELSFISIAHSRESVPSESVGRAFHGVELSIRRPDGSAADTGEVGIVTIKSPMISHGYLEPVDQAGFHIDQGWASVGDWGWCDASGYLYWAGREQDMILTGGQNVFPAEVEAALQTLPEVAEAVVFGIPDRERGQIIAAALRWVDRPLSRAALHHKLLPILPAAKCPRQYFTVTELPHTPSGKVMRSLLQQWVSDRSPNLVQVL